MEKLDHPLAGQDVEIVGLVKKELKKLASASFPGQRSQGRDRPATGGCELATNRGEELAADLALVCAGRRPSTGHLNLDAAGVRTGGRGEVLVNDRLETSAPGIFAAGDILGPGDAVLDGHPGGHRGRRKRHGRRPGARREDHPERHLHPARDRLRGAHRGGRRRPRAFLILRASVPTPGSLKACVVQAHGSGIIKMLFERDSHRLLGAHIFGSEAGRAHPFPGASPELGARAEDFAHAIYHHPSLSEGFREAAAEALRS